MGASGDMLAGALLSLFDNKEGVINELNSLNIPNTSFSCTKKEDGVKFNVKVNGEEETPDSHHHHHHHGRHLDEVLSIIDNTSAPDKVKDDAKAIYSIIAQAESKAHGVPVGEVHFHEVGMLDAIADVTVSAYLINKLNVNKIITSPVNVGNGTVHCAHGEMPVPAPATANILTEVPYYKSDINTELCTPTGAAILKYFTNSFENEPKLDSVKKIGIGYGTKEFKRANILRVFAYEENESITELSCNIDDITGEEAAFAAERIMQSGALDCFITPIIMKKGRPAYMLTVLCKNDDCDKFAKLIFKHTTTIGLRKYMPSRYTLEREFTENSGVSVKRSEGYGAIKEKAEFEGIKALALKEDISIFEAKKRLKK